MPTGAAALNKPIARGGAGCLGHVFRRRKYYRLGQSITGIVADDQRIDVDVVDGIAEPLRPFKSVDPAQTRVTLLERLQILAADEDTDIGSRAVVPVGIRCHRAGNRESDLHQQMLHRHCK